MIFMLCDVKNLMRYFFLLKTATYCLAIIKAKHTWVYDLFKILLYVFLINSCSGREIMKFTKGRLPLIQRYAAMHRIGQVFL